MDFWNAFFLNMHRYENEEQLQKYLEYCRKKAFQIKKVSDRLFEYFLVYGKEEKELQLQTIPCEEMAEDLCNGQFFDWQDRGGTIDCQIGELPGSVQVDSEYMQRVMDNLLSNLKKYGDPAYPLQIQIDEHQDMLHIRRRLALPYKGMVLRHAEGSLKIMEEPLRGELIHRKIPLPLRWNFRWRKGR